MNIDRRAKQLFIAAVVATLFGLFSIVRLAQADSVYFPIAPGFPLLQAWTDTSLISSNDNWSGVPSIMGYRGDDIVVVIQDIDPQTVLADYSAIVDVNANNAVPNVFVTAGVTEFNIVNPVVALAGNGASDFPNIEIRLDTSGCTKPNSVSVSYNLRDIESSSDNSVQQFALQYRIGATGNFTNIPEAYVADATTGPSMATLVTPVAVILPAIAQGESQVHLRIITTNAAGNDEWVGIDDINVSCVSLTAAKVSLQGRVVTAEGRGIAGARIVVSGGTLARPLYATASPFGYYKIEGLRAGETYLATVKAKRYTFASPDVVILMDDQIEALDFVAEPF